MENRERFEEIIEGEIKNVSFGSFSFRYHTQTLHYRNKIDLLMESDSPVKILRIITADSSPIQFFNPERGDRVRAYIYAGEPEKQGFFRSLFEKPTRKRRELREIESPYRIEKINGTEVFATLNL